MHRSLSAVIVTYGRPTVLEACLDAVRGSDRAVDEVVLYDNSPDRWACPPADVTYLWTGENVGLPAAIGHGMDATSGADAVLVLDDDTVIAPDTLRLLEEQLVAGVGAVSVPLPFDLDRSDLEGGQRWFPWSPTLLSREAIDASGRPLGSLFFGWDDWEYACRIRRAGFEISWLVLELPQHQMPAGREWPGRAYLDVRNSVYLVTRGRVLHRALVRHVASSIRVAFRTKGAPATALRRGLRDGLLGRLGPPPADLAPSVAAARAGAGSVD